MPVIGGSADRRTTRSGPGCRGGGYAGIPSAWLVDPTSGTWTETGSMTAGRMRHTLTLLKSGQVLAVGGRKVVKD
jgi:hypothetical protein